MRPIRRGKRKRHNNRKRTSEKYNSKFVNADSIGNEKYFNFVTERLVKGTMRFSKPIAKLKIALSIKSKKEIPRQYQ